MRTIKMMSAVLCLTFASTGPAAAQSIPASRAADAALIKKEIEIICQAFIDKDRKTLEDTHGTHWRGFTPWSDHVIRGRDGYMNEATFDPRTPKGQGMIGYRISDFDAVFYGDSAVASFVLDVDSMRGTQKVSQKLTILDVFHKEGGRWIQVASNTSLHAEALERSHSALTELGEQDKQALLGVREKVWRDWFSGNTDGLKAVLPPELITISASDATFGSLESNLAESRAFAAGGGKLTRLTFPITRFQAYGATAILYTTYYMEFVAGGTTRAERGSAVEVFVRQNGRWVHTGWQLAPASR